MNRFILFLILPAIFIATQSPAKGHGGGHGGGGHHGGGHGGGNGHGGGAGHSGGFGAQGHNSGAKNTSRSTGSNNAARTAPRTRILPGGYRAPVRNLPTVNNRGGFVPMHANDPYKHGTSYPYYYYGYDPFFFNPYFGMFSFGMGAMYSPMYATAPVNYYVDDNAPNYPSEDELDGYVVYELDTISGAITIKSNTISLETADTTRGYDYKFKMKQKGLAHVTVYNDDDKQLNLVRLKDHPKKLLRVVHQGKLSVYDERHDFIYKPEDIDIRTIMVVYNGEEIPIHTHSPEVTKQRLTAFVNKAYGTDLDPKKFSWKELLIYIDKLD